MKVLSTEGLTKLIQLIKSSFISTSNTVTTNTVTLADVATSGDFDDLINKPTIPTVGNGTVTINQGGTQKGTFTLNQSGNATINLDAGGGGAVDQTFDGTSQNAQSGVAIQGELENYAPLYSNVDFSNLTLDNSATFSVEADAETGDKNLIVHAPIISMGTNDYSLDFTSNGVLINGNEVATQTWVTNQGYTTNVGTVTSVNNVQPVNGNVTISIPTAISDLTDDTSTNPIDKAESVADQRDSSSLKYWTGTKAQYDAIATKDDNTIYNVDDSSTLVVDILNSLYPIGAIYIGTMATCPLSVLGVGTWQLVAQDRVLQGAGTRGAVGTTINESLPNITGTLYQDGIAGSGTTNGVVWGSSGVFGTITSSGTSRAKYSIDTTGAVKDTIPFNASNSSSTYQDNAPVQQDGYLVNIWERIS